VNMR